MNSREHSGTETDAFPATSPYDFCDLPWDVRKPKRFVRQKDIYALFSNKLYIAFTQFR